jgi:amino acid adenylation domain-containing protein
VAGKYADRVAVQTRACEWSYDELDRAANGVARSIVEHRLAPDDRIALYLDHDAPLLACLLGALKAGKTYVPLDPSYPEARSRLILDDCGAAAVLTDRNNLDRARALAGDDVPLIEVDPAPGDAAPPGIAVDPDDLAYLLYTSGSTGVPKGTMQSHRNVLHHIRNYTNALHIRTDDRLTLLSSYTFDAAVMDIFGALLNGATLCLRNLKEEGLQGFSGWLADQGITIYHSTPTVYRYLVGTLTGKEAFPALRFIVLGGEAVYTRDVELYREHFPPDCLLVNGFGPTESTMALQYFLDRNQRQSRNSVPVGFAVEDAGVLLLDPEGRRTEIYGEIAIRSPAVALGYWRRPELTATAFLPDPADRGRRIYRTGDMGRMLPDGGIEFVGRKDQRVKVRGHRIELGDVEKALLDLGSIREAVVVSLGSDADQRLVAYFVPGGPSVPPVPAIRRALLKKLPDYMVPSAYVPLDSLPVTPNGKVDRRALPEPDTGRRQLEDAVVAPRTAEEEELSRLWSELLGVERVGIHDDFFDLGGHSLLATQLVSRVRVEFGVELPLRSLFERSTVAGMVESLEQARRVEAPPVRPVRRDGELPLSFAQERLWFLDRLMPGSPFYNLPAGVRLLGPVEFRALEECFNEILRRHEVLRTAFPSVRGRPVQSILPFTPLTMPLVDLSGLPEEARGEAVCRLADADARRPFDVSRGPLLRLRLLRLNESEHVVLLNMHHIVSDGWSLGVFVDEFAELYQARREGRLRGVATAVAGQRRGGAAARLLAGAAGGPSRPAAGDRSAASCGSELSR